jgi:hypothetical protein
LPPQVCAHKQQLADELSQLTGKHKQLQQEREALHTELLTLKPAHAELQQMHDKAKAELQNTKAALQKSQEARVHAEVGFPVYNARPCVPQGSDNSHAQCWLVVLYLERRQAWLQAGLLGFPGQLQAFHFATVSRLC